MYHPRITDAAAESLVAMPQLESLTIQWSRFGDAGLKRLAAADRLKHLGLESSPFTNAGAEALASCQQLKELGLLSDGLTAECLKPFERMTWLTELSVSYPGARRDDFQSLRTALPKTELRQQDYSPDTRPGFRAGDGQVIDAESGQPVEHFVSQFGHPDRVTGEIQWEAPRTEHSLSVTGLQPDRKFRLIADGYEPVEITALMSNEPGTKHDQMIVRMRRVTKK